MQGLSTTATALVLTLTCEFLAVTMSLLQRRQQHPQLDRQSGYPREEIDAFWRQKNPGKSKIWQVLWNNCRPQKISCDERSMTYAELIWIKKNRRQTWFEITNLRREAITRGEGGSVHVYGFQRDLRHSLGPWSCASRLSCIALAAHLI